MVLIIDDTNIIILYKTTRNSGLVFNLATTKFFDTFCTVMLAFLFAIIYSSISKY